MNSKTFLFVAVLLPVLTLAQETKEETFWKWFVQNQDELFHYEKDQKAVFDRLANAMKKVHADLTFEFGPIQENGAREFIISAGGVKAAFPSVESLHAAAPKLSKWTVLKFRQRRFPINDLEFSGRTVKSDDVHYVIFKDDDPKKVGIMIFFDGYSEKNKSVWGQMGYLFLDEALGEYDVETHVGAIVFFDRKSKYFEHARPLSELPSHFDERLNRNSNVAKDGK